MAVFTNTGFTNYGSSCDSDIILDFSFFYNRQARRDADCKGFLIDSFFDVDFFDVYYLCPLHKYWVKIENPMETRVILSNWQFGYYSNFIVTRYIKVFFRVLPFSSTKTFNLVSFYFNTSSSDVESYYNISSNFNPVVIPMLFYSLSHMATSIQQSLQVSFDFSNYLNSFGKDLSSDNVKCFKCGFPLSVSNNALQCQNSHNYTFEEYILQHSDYLKCLIDSTASSGICPY